ncbi:hypothetical protein D0Z03_002327 [Geotrichum reessii]|nr:hypothetical protein D0Z03_002327 [Galactomyces reessii]
MHSARRQKEAKIIASLYDEEDESPAPVLTKADAEMLDAPVAGIKVADLDVRSAKTNTPDNHDDNIITLDDDTDGNGKYDDDEDDFIPLDPETIAEERELLEAELYNEQDLEEGVGFQDEELALDNRQRNAQEDERRREMREAIADYENELQAGPGEDMLSTSTVHNAVRNLAWSSSSAPGYGTNGHPLPSLPLLADSLSRLRMRLAGLEAQRTEHRTGLASLDTERRRISERQAELQAKLDQAGLDYQLARVALDARQGDGARVAESDSLTST